MIHLSVSITVVASVFTVGTSYFLPCRRIDAAVRWSSSNTTHLFSADEYIVYNDEYDAEEDVLSVSQLADGFPSNIDAAVNWFGKRKSFYFKGCSYYKFHEVRQRLQRRRVSRLGLPCNVDAALNHDGQHVLIFKGCQYWTITRTNRRAVLSGTTGDLGLPCDVDAALTWRNGTSYVIKDDVMWSLTSSNSAEYRLNLDEWSLCSWRICVSSDANSSSLAQLEQEFPCNGDRRFCSLKLDQATLAGSHNAGSGFDGGFGFLSCWVRNQYMTVLEQLRFGVRYLDVDTSWEHCGLLGTFHNFACGGPLCRMIKQIKRFLRESRHEVVVVNFNHEMRDHQRVLPALVRQMTAQLGNYVNSYFRDVGIWPSLHHAVASNRRLFVIIDKRVASVAYSTYFRHRWIHSERLLQSTWRGDVSVDGSCEDVVENSHQQCESNDDAPLLEISILGHSTSCVTTIADLCLPLVHRISRLCQDARHGRGRAPNVLLVDFPERAPRAALSVVSAAFLQNVRNVARLSRAACHVRVDAAVVWAEQGGELRVLFFSGSRPVLYNWHIHTQENIGAIYAEGLPATADAAFRRAEDPRDVCFVRGCAIDCWHVVMSAPPRHTSDYSLEDWGLPCHIHSAFTSGNYTYFFTDCSYWQRSTSGHVTGPQPVASLGLQCNISAALQAPDGATYYFKEDNYWKYTADQGLSPAKSVLDWSADFLQC